MGFRYGRSIRVSKEGLWILTSLVEYQVRLSRFDRDNTGQDLNFPDHLGIRGVELRSLFEDLLKRGWIAHQRGGTSTDPYLGLTPKGGSVWERIAKPDWNRFVDLRSYRGHDSSSARSFIEVAEGRNLDFLTRYATAYGLHQSRGIDPHGERVLGEWKLRTLAPARPWNATYWKSFPVGYRIRVQVQTTRDIVIHDSPSRAILQSYRWHGANKLLRRAYANEAR